MRPAWSSMMRVRWSEPQPKWRIVRVTASGISVDDGTSKESDSKENILASLTAITAEPVFCHFGRSSARLRRRDERFVPVPRSQVVAQVTLLYSPFLATTQALAAVPP